MAIRLATLLLLAALPASAAEPSVSTAPASGRATPLDNPWSLNYGFDRRGQRYGLDYRIRWDLGDLAGSPRKVRDNLASPTDTAESVVYGLLSGASLDLYGVRVRPFRSRSSAPRAMTQEGVAASTSAVSAATAPSLRPRLTLDPFGDLSRNGRREAESFILREGFDLAVPSQRGAPGWQKEAVSRSVLDAGRSWSDDGKPFVLPLPIPSP